MGVGDWLREKASNIPGYTKPLTDAAKALTPALPEATPAAPATTPKTREERQTDYLNRNNPSYVPRAKGGCVSKGGAPMMNVDKPVTFESFKGKGKP